MCSDQVFETGTGQMSQRAENRSQEQMSNLAPDLGGQVPGTGQNSHLRHGARGGGGD